MRYFNAIGIMFLLGVVGCYGYYGVEVEAPSPHGQVIIEAPPAPLMEEPPPPPYEEAVWVGGYWNWTGVRYVWVRGRYLRPPSVGLLWYPGGYVRRGNGYVYVRGRWAGRGYRPRYRYVHPRRSYGHRHYQQRQYQQRRYSTPRGPTGPYDRTRSHRAPAVQKRKKKGTAVHSAPPAKRQPRRHQAPPARKSRRNAPPPPGR